MSDFWAAPPAGQRFELRNARLLDVAGGGYFDSNVRLIVQDGQILAMPGLPGQPAEIAVDRAMDLGGRAVLPGLFNTHAHLEFKHPTALLSPLDLLLTRLYAARQTARGLADCLLHGVTYVRDTLCNDLRPNRRWAERIQRGELPGPRLAQSVLVAPPGGAFTQSISPFFNLAALVLGQAKPPYNHPNAGAVLCPPDATAAQARAAVDRAIDERRAQTIKFYDQEEFMPFYCPGARVLNAVQLSAAADQARRRGIPSTLHHASLAAFRRGVAAGVTSLAHLPIDAPLTEADVLACQRAGCILEPTLTIAYFYSWRMPAAPWNDHPNFLRLSELRRRTWDALIEEFCIPPWAASRRRMLRQAQAGQLHVMGVRVSRLFRYWGPLISLGVENLARLYAAGAPIACGNDVGANSASEAMIQLELSLLDLCLGWSPAERLRAATLHSARALGVDDRFASLSPGKAADLLVLDGDPLRQPDLLGGRAAALWLGGRLVVNNLVK